MSLTLGRTAAGDVSQGMSSTNVATDAHARIGIALSIVDAPITVSKIGIRHVENDVNGKFKPVLCKVTDAGFDGSDENYSIDQVLAYGVEFTIAGNHATDGLHEHDLIGGPIVIASNMLIAIGFVGYQTDTSSNYAWLRMECQSGSSGWAQKLIGPFDYNALGAHTLDTAGGVGNGGGNNTSCAYIVYDLGSGGAVYTDAATEPLKLTPSASFSFAGVDAATEAFKLTPSGVDAKSLKQIQRPAGPSAIGTSLSTFYTVPTGKKFIVRDMHICNTSGVARSATLLVGGQEIYYNEPVDINSSVPWSGWMVMLAGETIQAQADATGLTLAVSGVEV